MIHRTFSLILRGKWVDLLQHSSLLFSRHAPHLARNDYSFLEKLPPPPHPVTNFKNPVIALEVIKCNDFCKLLHLE